MNDKTYRLTASGRLRLQPMTPQQRTAIYAALAAEAVAARDVLRLVVADGVGRFTPSSDPEKLARLGATRERTDELLEAAGIEPAELEGLTE